jgi:hypothetical protein
MAMMKPKKQRTDRIESVGGGARGSSGRGVKSVEVSSNVTVKAPKGKTISPTEAARLKNISKAPKTTKGNANALKASGKPSKSKKANTKYEQYDMVDGKFTTIKGTARDFAQKRAEKRIIERKRAGFTK